MKTTVKNLSETKIQLTVTLNAEDLKKAEEKAIARLAKGIKLEGFRAGKAPLDLAKKAIDTNELNSQTLDIAVRTSVPSAFSEASKQPLVIPNVEVTKFVPGEMAEYTATADILPEIKLGDYKNLKVKKTEQKTKESDITEVLENIRSAYAEKKVVKRAAKMGDEVILDFVGKKDGKAFDGGSAKDHHLTLGSHTFIPGFEEGLVGHSSGDKFNLDITFPADYGAKALAGAKTVFEILIKQVNAIEKPELNSAFAEKCGPFKSVDELKADIKKNLDLQNQSRVIEKFKDDLVVELVRKSTVSAPDILIEDQLRLVKQEEERNAQMRGQNLKDYIEATGEKFDHWEKDIRKLAEERVKASLCLQILANQEKISTSDEEADAQIAILRDRYKSNKDAVKNLKDPRVKNDIKNRMTIDKTLDYLVKVNEK